MVVVEGDRSAVCALGHVHRGALGGAGLLLRCAPSGGRPMYLLAQRSATVDEPGCWGIPGGARQEGETPEATAAREIEEELATLPAYRIAEMDPQDCGGGWLFWVIVADVDHRVDVFCGAETDRTGWFTYDQMLDLHLHRELRRWVQGRAL